MEQKRKICKLPLRVRVTWRKNGRRLLTLALGGTLAGFFNGLLGAGGGIILVITLSALLPKDGEGARSVYANALLVTVPLSCLTLFNYFRGGALVGVPEGAISVWLILGGIAGGALGGLLLGRIRSGALGRLFALLTVVSGIIMLTR